MNAGGQFSQRGGSIFDPLKLNARAKQPPTTSLEAYHFILYFLLHLSVQVRDYCCTLPL